ncbi:nuclear transport factor 2 family protein [Rhizorhabdus wittichii]|uniref:Nuclear transport factor 2 family protein n=1 Tax=Rhizorhabdus wittichii TaxID=160791 RepID=A0A975D128_9SPHN|nr:nuclear transport factor 2 family protein [Rhizorhabdus wittichii]
MAIHCIAAAYGSLSTAMMDAIGTFDWGAARGLPMACPKRCEERMAMDEGERGIAGVIAAEQRRGEALVARDFATLRTLVAPDITHTHTRGVTDDFDGYFRFVEQELAFLEASRGPLDVRISGDIAVMTGTMDNLVLPRGREEPIRTRAQALQVWAWRDGGWRMIAFQSTNLPA